MSKRLVKGRKVIVVKMKFILVDQNLSIFFFKWSGMTSHLDRNGCACMISTFIHWSTGSVNCNRRMKT